MLSNPQKQHLRALAHGKKPVVIIGGKGLTQAVLDEIDSAIAHHELVKVRINTDDRESRSRIIEAIGEVLQAELVQRIGHVAVFFRHNEDQNKDRNRD